MSESKSGSNERTDWKAAFSPPPPQQLLPAPRAAAAARERPATVRAVPDLAPLELAPAAAPASTPATAPGEAEQASAAPAGRAERAIVETVLATLAQESAGARLTAVARKPGVLSLELEMDSVEDALKVGALCPELADELGVDQVRVQAGPTAQQVRLEVVTAAANASTLQLGVYMPVELRDGADAARAVTGQTFTGFVLGAFNRRYEELAGMFPPAPGQGGPMPITRRRNRRRVPTGVQVWLYVTPVQAQVLEETIERVGAGSRSALVSKLLAADLGIDLDRLVIEG